MKNINVLNIKTPEGITFPLILAGPLSRCMALSIDFFLVLTASTIISKITMLFIFISEDIVQALNIIIFSFLFLSYTIISEWYFNGKTFGKNILGLQVIDIEGFPLTLSQVVIRNIMRFIDSLPFFYMIGGLTCLLNPKYQRLGDITAGTLVIRTIKISKPDISSIITNKYNSFRDYPVLAARLRDNIPPEISGILFKVLLRRESLEPEIRFEIYSEIVEVLKKYAKFPKEATQDLSDEQFLKNCLEIIFN
jgi:uncharacterized RDD family membrane protein YckC